MSRLEGQLQGTTPLAFSLWNEVGKNEKGKAVFRPKEEERLSDLVKTHLNRDLRESSIVVNREVQIRPGAGVGIGEDTDIHVDAVVRDAEGNVRDVISVIIEVKGCWNRELKSAMQSQLAERYLKGQQRCSARSLSHRLVQLRAVGSS